MVEERIERSRLLGPGKVVGYSEPLRQIAQDARDGPRLTGGIEDFRHQVQMRVRALAADVLEPRGGGEEQVRVGARGVVREEIVARDEIGGGERTARAARVRERREHVGAEEEQ